MPTDSKKYLDIEGVKYLWSKISLEDYPNNETLIAVLKAIDETKANTEHNHTIAHVEGLQSELDRINSNSSPSINLLNGSAAGSLRTISSKLESADYAIGVNAVTFGKNTKATGDEAFAEGTSTQASDGAAHAEGSYTTAGGYASHAEGGETATWGNYSHVEGYGTVSGTSYQHVQGRYNIWDWENAYLHIVGNGSSDSERSNAHTIDWNGNGWFQGTIETSAVILRSSTPGSIKKFKLTVDDSGVLSTEELTE